ncbi:hypothetical protein B0J14DRAFT_665967 [Halenospora varia]|nr:hypothetical protein B0J14DRAFT_665967 [Halenospora varia]
MLEVINMFYDAWTEALQPRSRPAEDTMPWLWVAWAFGKPVEFNRMRRILEHEADDMMDEDIEGTNPTPKARKDAKYEKTTTPICPTVFPAACGDETSACDSIMLGSLRRACYYRSSTDKVNLLDLKPPYMDKTITEVLFSVQNIRPISLCSDPSIAPDFSLYSQDPQSPFQFEQSTQLQIERCSSPPFGVWAKPPTCPSTCPSRYSHGIREHIIRQIRDIEGRFDGLDIKDF